MLKQGIPEHQIDFYLDEVDGLANLQLLEGLVNSEKQAMDFAQWLDETNNGFTRNDFMHKHHIPAVDLSLQNFEEFIESRKKMMKTKFEGLLRL